MKGTKCTINNTVTGKMACGKCLCLHIYEATCLACRHVSLALEFESFFVFCFYFEVCVFSGIATILGKTSSDAKKERLVEHSLKSGIGRSWEAITSFGVSAAVLSLSLRLWDFESGDRAGIPLCF